MRDQEDDSSAPDGSAKDEQHHAQREGEHAARMDRGQRAHEEHLKAREQFERTRASITETWQRLVHTRGNAPLSAGFQELRRATLNLLEDAELARRAEAEQTAQRERAEAASRASEARLQLALDAASMGTFLWHPQEDRTEPDPRMLALFGLPSDGTLNLAQALATLIHPDDCARYAAAVARALDFAGDGALREEIRIRRADDGAERWIAVTGQTVFAGEPPRALRMSGVCADITERKRREANLAFLAEVSQDLGRLTNLDETLHRLGAKIGQFFGVKQCMFAEHTDGLETSIVTHGWNAEGAPDLRGTYRTRDFLSDELMAALRAGEPLVVGETQRDARVNAASYGAFGVRALIIVPLVRDGAWQFQISILDDKPREWTPDEIALLRELTTRVWTRLERARAVEALRASEEKYRSLFTSMDEGFCTIEVLFDAETGEAADYRFLETNPAFARQTGLENVLGKTARELLPEHEEFWFETYGHIARSGEAMRFEHEARALGRFYDVYAFRAGEPHENRVAVIFNDIGGRKQAEEAVRASEERLRTLADAVPQIIWTNSAEGVANYFNQRWFEYSGLSHEASVGVGWEAIVHPDDAPGSKSAWQRALTAGEVFDTEYRLRGANGGYRWFIGRNVPMRDGARRVTGWFGTATDIHDLKVAEAARRESEEHARALIANLPGGAAFIVDRDLRYVLAGGEALHEVGLGPSDFVGKTVQEALPTEQVEARTTHYRQALAGEGFTHEHESRGRYFLTRGVPLRDERGAVMQALAVSYDITARKRSEEALRESEEKYRTLFELVPVAVVLCNAAGVVQEYNRPAVELWGRAPERGNPAERYCGSFLIRDRHGKIVPHDESPMARVLRGETLEPGDLEAMVERPNGTLRHVVLSLEVLRDESAEVVGAINCLYDITEHKAAQEALRTGDERFRIALEAAEMAAWDYDTTRDRVIWNAQHYRLLGREPDGQPQQAQDFLRAVHPDDLAMVTERLRIAVEETGVYRADFRIVRADNGAVRWMSGFGRAVDRSGETVTRMIGVMFDTTEQREAEEKLAAAEERLRLLVESALEHAIISLDLERRVTSWNPGAESIIGYTTAEMLGQTGDVIFTPEDRAAGVPVREAQEALERGHANDNRWQQRKDGTRFWANGAMLPMRSRPDGEIIGFVKILRDETETQYAREALEGSRAALLSALQETERARAEAEAAGRAKDHFLAVLSHELRTPLTPVLMATHTLARRKDLPKPVSEALDMIRRNVQLEAHFVDDLLDVTRIARGKMEIVRAPTDLHAAIEHAVEVSRPDLEAKNQRLTVALEAREHRVDGDALRLQQVVWNLLKNAAKFTPEGGQVAVRTRNDETGRVVLEVSDTGIGLKAETLSRIFDPFAQASAEITREFGGLGLGLAISKATVEAHGGEIRAESAGPGRGATFRVSLPLLSRHGEEQISANS